MPRNKLSKRQMLAGAKAALSSPRTPAQFRPGLLRLVARLEKELRQEKAVATQRSHKARPKRDLVWRLFGWWFRYFKKGKPALLARVLKILVATIKW